MNVNSMKKWLPFILCVALIAAIALTAMGCTDTNPETPETGGDTTVTTTEGGTTAETPDPNAPTVKGEGAAVFYFNVLVYVGEEATSEIYTDKTTVGEALLELGLIEGDMGDYGLYVKKVNGITADYEVDGTYWAFYIGDDYGMTGVDMTNIEPGTTYAFKVSK